MKARVPQNIINSIRRTGTVSLVHWGKSNKKDLTVAKLMNFWQCCKGRLQKTQTMQRTF